MKNESEIPFNSIITEPTILNLMGCVYYGNPFHSAGEWSYDNEIGNLWKRFMKLSMGHYRSFFQKVAKEPGIAYEMHLETSEFKETKRYYVFVGIETKKINNQPLELFTKILPETQYLQFTSKADDSKDADYIMRKWLNTKSTGYRQNYPFILQRYDERYKGLHDLDSEIDWMIPISFITKGKN